MKIKYRIECRVLNDIAVVEADNRREAIQIFESIYPKSIKYTKHISIDDHIESIIDEYKVKIEKLEKDVAIYVEMFATWSAEEDTSENLQDAKRDIKIYQEFITKLENRNKN